VFLGPKDNCPKEAILDGAGTETRGDLEVQTKQDGYAHRHTREVSLDLSEMCLWLWGFVERITDLWTVL
jgi:hypothetical protein